MIIITEFEAICLGKTICEYCDNARVCQHSFDATHGKTALLINVGGAIDGPFKTYCKHCGIDYLKHEQANAESKLASVSETLILLERDGKALDE